MMDVLGGILLVIGASFILLAGVGVVRFPDVYSRMQAAAKAPALGVIGICSGTAITVGTLEAIVASVLVIVLQLIAGPVGTHLLGRAVWLKVRPDMPGPDELAEAEAAERKH